ncbi:MAG: tetratricopeptide repeat protein [Ferruginibacter sp.]|nr:tetratricopeptide repeat protein [Ferruginibacter sp.]
MKTYTVLVLAICISCNSNPNEKKIPEGALSDSAITKENQIIAKIKQFPDSIVVKEELIEFYREAGQYDKALRETQKYLDKDNNARWWKIKATLCYEKGKVPQSIEAFEKAIALYPAINDIINLGIIYAETSNAKALKTADFVESYDKSFVKDAWYIRGLYQTYNNNKIEAVKMFDKVIGVNHTYMDAYREKAIALYDLKKYKEAAETLIHATKLKNNFEEGYYYLGKCYEALKQPVLAKDAYHKALFYASDYREAQEALDKLNETQ